MAKKGLLISFEGGEGSGKGTQVEILTEVLQKEGIEVVLTREPGGTEIGEKIRHLLKHDPAGKNMVPEAELLLFLAARAQNSCERIAPALEQGKVVICDRFIDSSVVYQGMVRGLGMQQVMSLNSFATRGIVPDLTLVLDLPVEVGLARVKKRADQQWDRLDSESKEFHLKVRQGYQELAEVIKGRGALIDANRGIDEIAGDVSARVQELLVSHQLVEGMR